MKKKCTNSACRRVFTPWLEADGVKCPHCGKRYPRLKVTQARIPSLVATGLKPGAAKIAIIKLIRRELLLTLRESKARMDNINTAPIVINQFRTQEPKALMAEMEQLGLIVRMDYSIPGSRVSPPPDRFYNIILAGYDPGHRDDAKALLNKHSDFRYLPPKEIDTILQNRRVLLSRRVYYPYAQYQKAEFRKTGIRLELRRISRK